MTTQGSYAGSELQIVIAQDNLDLLEVADVNYSIDLGGRPGGAGMGHPEHRYHKFGTLTGTFSISRRMLAKADGGDAFLSLVAGSAFIQQESIASGSATYTPSFSLQSILTIRYVETGLRLKENLDYTVNWASNVITFTPALADAAEIIYLSDATDSPSPFVFDIVYRRRSDHVTVRKLKGCVVDPNGGGASEGEDVFLSGSFLSMEGAL